MVHANTTQFAGWMNPSMDHIHPATFLCSMDAMYAGARQANFPTGWISKIAKIFSLSSDDIFYLDDVASKDKRELFNLEAEMKRKLKLALAAFKMEVYNSDKEYYQARRREFLKSKRLKEVEELTQYRVGMGKSETGIMLFDDSPYTLEIKKIDKEIEMLNRVDIDGSLTQMEIERARDHPLSEVVGCKVGAKIICPFHDDHHPSMQVYKLTGFCFVCQKSVDSIGWLMEQGLSFVTAVKRLA